MSELKKPTALQLRHNNSEGFVYAYEKEEMDKYLSEADKVIAHHKYQRCLAMAAWCAAMYDFMCSTKHNVFWERWHKRWLKLADKLKEAK